MLDTQSDSQYLLPSTVHFLSIYNTFYFRRSSNKKKQETDKEKTTAGTNEPPKAILFATLVPAIPALLKKSRTDRVKSILGTKFRFNFNPGAKRIDVISRVMFPGTFACLNIAYWAYYLTTAEQASLDSL